MPKIAWAKQVFSAYHEIKKNQKVFLADGTYLELPTVGQHDYCY